MSGASRPATARLFVALELPASPREALAAWGAGRARADPALRALRADALHLTLCFLGSRPEGEAAAIGSAVARCAGPAPEVAPGDEEWLPPGRPRVLAVGIRDLDGRLGELHAEVAEALVAGGWHRPERRSFRAHVSVARVRRGERPRVRGPDGTKPSPEAFACEWLTLFRSRLGGGPARYEALARVPLARGRGA